MEPAELALEAGVGPHRPRCGSGNARSRDRHVRPPAGPGSPLLLEILVPTRVDIDDRNNNVAITPDQEAGKAVSVTWVFEPVEGTMMTHPGVYSLRSNVLDWDADSMWKTYVTLTDAEAIYRLTMAHVKRGLSTGS